MICTKQGEAPFVIDRRLPPIFERAPNTYELVATENYEPMLFSTPEEAETYLRERLDQHSIASFEWTITPFAETTA